MCRSSSPRSASRTPAASPIGDLCPLCRPLGAQRWLLLTPHCRRLGGRELLAAGFEHPRIAVAGLNPHNGDGGVFGSEEIDVIGPAVAELVAEIGENISGPFPSDTIFLKAVAGEVDAVVTVPPSSPLAFLSLPTPSSLAT